MINFEKAIELILDNAGRAKIVKRNLQDSPGFVLAENISADRDYPPFNRATMDGFALNTEYFNEKREKKMFLTGVIHAGEDRKTVVLKNTCVKIMTGAPLPKGADAVIKIEDTQQDGDNIAFNVDRATKWQNVAVQGGDTLKGGQVASAGDKCDASLIKILASVGREKISVYAAPSIRIIVTGTEIVPISGLPEFYQIRDANSEVLKTLLAQYHCENCTAEIIPDERDLLEKAVVNGLENDMLIISGGVSMGDKDFVPAVLASAGVKKIFHKVNMKPGKPAWFGKHKNGCAVFGAPGNPMSCQVVFKMLIEPYIRKFMQFTPAQPLYIQIQDIRKKSDPRLEFFPCRIISDSKTKKNYLIPIQYNNSGDIRAGYNADGIAVHPAEMPELPEGYITEFYPW